jgi:hypothetical protein
LYSKLVKKNRNKFRFYWFFENWIWSKN